ncbi:MAG: hypothetical protein WBC97_02385 [Gemmatimonadales bacterium]
MATKLDKSIKRELTLGEKTYTIVIAPEGIKITFKGGRKGVDHSWAMLVAALDQQD